MVQLRDVAISSWTAAANEWKARADDLLGQARDVKRRVSDPLGQAWSGPAGSQVAGWTQSLLEQIEIDSLECRSVALIVHGAGHALQIAQSSLLATLTLARQEEFRVSDDGTVHLPTHPMVRHDPDYFAWCRAEQQRLRRLIDNAVRVATTTDHTAHDALERLSRRTNVIKLSEAQNGDLADASRLEVDLIASAIPRGSPDEIAAWWASLSDADRSTLKLAAPWTLVDLDGIPGDVRSELRGGDGYDRTGVAKWAIDHWTDNSDDPFDDNCTNFASNALEGAGLHQHNDIWTGTLSSNSWSKVGQTGWNWLDEHDYTHSASWAQAQTSYDFWTEPDHGQEVSIADARPGDIIYWEQGEAGYDIAPGSVHHTAVVTAVVDGDIRYTQHSGNQLHASLDGRSGINALTGGTQRIHIVRPNPDW